MKQGACAARCMREYVHVAQSVPSEYFGSDFCE